MWWLHDDSTRTPHARHRRRGEHRLRILACWAGIVSSQLHSSDRHPRLSQSQITGIAASPVGFTDTQLATRYRFTVNVAVRFEDAREKKTLWENPALAFSDEYELANRSSLTLGASAFLDQERVAIDRLSTDFARTVVQAILEAF
jgi:hypothetical protein